MKRYVRSDVNNANTPMYSVAVKYKGKCIGFVTTHFQKGLTQMQGKLYIQMDKDVRNYGVWKARKSKVQWHVRYTSANSYSYVIVLNNRDILCEFANSNNPFAVVPTSRLGTVGRRAYSETPMIEFNFEFEMIPSEQVESTPVTPLTDLVDSVGDSLASVIPDYNDFNYFLEGFNHLWDNFLETHSISDLVEHGIGYYFDDLLPAIDEAVEHVSTYPDADRRIAYFFDNLPDPYRSELYERYDFE